jgi:hypothetical protein
MTLTSLSSLNSQQDRRMPDLATDALHGLAGDVVLTVDPHTEADRAAVLLSFLAAVGNVIGRGPHARAEGDVHAANLFVAIVGDTSKGRKGTSWGRVREIVTRAAPDWESRIAGGLSSGEGLIWAVRDPIETRRRARNNEDRERADEEGFVTEVEDVGICDKRLLVVEGELAAPLRTMRRDSNTLSAVLRNLWDRGDVSTMTKNSPARTTGAHVSLIAHIVSDELRRELSAMDSANGFANRFLWVCSRRSKLLPDGGDLPPGEISLLAAELADVVDWGQRPRELQRSDDARQLWHAVYGPLSEGRPGMVGAVTSRAEAQVLRLSVLYAAMDRSPCIDLPHLSAALAVWDYCAASAKFIFGEQTGDRVADQVLSALVERPAGMTKVEVHAILGRHVSGERVAQAIDELQRAGLVDVVRVSTGGRPAERIQLRKREESEESERTAA